MKNILISGPLLSNSGYGVHSRQVFNYLNSLKNVKVFCNITKWGDVPWHLTDEYTGNSFSKIIKSHIPESSLTNITFDEAYSVSYPHEWIMCGKKNIGITAGVETDLVPFHWLKYVNKVDTVICTSNFTAQAFYNQAELKNFKLNKKINVVHQYYYEEFIEEKVEINKLKEIKTENNLLLIGQLTDNNSELDRKNIFNAIESLTRIMSNVESSGIIIKTNLGNNSYVDYEFLLNKISHCLNNIKIELGDKMPKIYVLHGNLKPLEIKSLYESEKVSAMISLSKGEGFGLNLLEAASCGLPIIATDYSAYKEFLEDSFVKVDYELKEIPQRKVDYKIYSQGSKWACYDNKSLHKAVLKFFNNKDYYYNISKDLQNFIKNNFNKKEIFKK